ncbi:MAG TPA: FAD:protein FMN transferase [Acidobacteriota bacterium]|nr:FAD:protein FMN transferase [Acidobacteriota bacterium]
MASKKTAFLLSALLSASAALKAGGSLGDSVRLEREVYLMGTRCRLTAAAWDRDGALSALERLLEALEASERQLSTWRQDSRLSQLNRHPLHQPLPLEPGLCRLFQQLGHWHALTEGAFDPAIGRLIAAWDIRGRGRTPPSADLAEALRASGFEHLELDASACRIERRRALQIDAGAFGKGEALDRALALSPQLRSELGLQGWLIDLGGQIGVWGEPEPGRQWEVSLAHPKQRGRGVLRLEVESGTIAVSGGSQRDLTVDGAVVSHILDPRSGQPVVFAGSTVVWRPDGLSSDVLSTALYVMGPREGLKWASRHQVAACFLIPQPEDGEEDSVRFKCSDLFRRHFPSSSHATLSAGIHRR